MTGTGAPKGNQYAKKANPGRTIGLYITQEDLQVLEDSLKKQNSPTSKLDIDRYARQIFKDAVKNIGGKNE